MMNNKLLKEVFIEDVKEYPNITDLIEEERLDDELKVFKKTKSLNRLHI